MYKQLESLYKLISVLYPDNINQVFNDKIKYIFEIFMGEMNFVQSKKDPLLYIEQEFNFFEPKQFDSEILDLFQQSSKRINLFKKPRKTLRLKQDLTSTINTIAKHDKFVQKILNEECKKLKTDIRYKSKQHQQIIYEQKRTENNQKRGRFYVEEIKYGTPTKINFDKICLVHATNFYPSKNKNGQYFIETTAHATKFLSPRPTVHFTCNHIVEEHMEGAAWSTMPYIIIAPFNDIVKINGKPRRFGLVDTYFLPDQESGVILPESLMIVEPAKKMPDGKLFIIAPNNHIFYRDKDFSDEQKQELAGNNWKNATDEELMIMSKKLAATKIMELNGFNYLFGNMSENYRLHQDFYVSGQSKGLMSVDNKYVHAGDAETFLAGQYENIVPIIQDIINEKRIDKKIKATAYEVAEKWLREHVIENKPVKKMQIRETDSEQIKIVKEKYNSAVKELKTRLQKQIKTHEDIAAFLSKEKD